MQVDRILRSEQFRPSEVLRRLLIYLTEKAVADEADTLKEYVVAIEGLGKPSSYDPQHNSTVRIQVGRLRQKLAEYYRNEGKNDPFVVDLPKGRFRLTCERRAESLEPPITPQDEAPRIGLGNLENPLPTASRLAGLGMGIALGLALAIAGYFGLRFTGVLPRTEVASEWSPEIEALWAPFLQSTRPLIFSVEDPLFVEVSSNPGIYYRDRSINRWSDVRNSPAVKKLSETFGKQEIQPSRYYTSFGEAEATFSLGRLMGSRGQIVSMIRTSQLSWQQLADNNIIFVGVQNLFFEQLQGMPNATELVADLDGVHNTHPAPGEPALFQDAYTTAPNEQGIIYALVTHALGPNGRGEVESFTSVRSAGYVGAVHFFTNPESAKLLVTKLKEQNGGVMPHTYQVLLKIRFKDNVPTETSYVLSRILHQR